MEEEKRKAQRIDKSFVIQYGFVSKKEDKRIIWDVSSVKDISNTGVSFITKESFIPDSRLELRIKLPFNPFQQIEIGGKVIRSEVLKEEMYLTRAEFVDLQEADKAAISSYIVWYREKKGETDDISGD